MSGSGEVTPKAPHAARMALVRARGQAMRACPYLARLLRLLEPYETERVPTLGTTPAGRMAYNPIYVLGLSTTQLAGVLLHELHHHVLRYWERQGERDGSRWNAAHDLEINDLLLRTGIELPAEGLRPEQFSLPRGALAEFYYERLPESHPCGCGIGEGAAGGDIDAEADAQGVYAPGPEELAGAKAEAGRQVIAGVAAPPGWIDQLLAALRPLVERTPGARDWSWTRTREREGVLWPRLRDEQVALGVVLDVSGSMTEHLPQAVAALRHVLAVLRIDEARCRIVAADTEAHPVTWAQAAAGRWPDVAGGGTDLRGAVRQVARGARAVLIVTDGETPWDVRPPAVERSVILGPPGAHGPRWPGLAVIRWRG